MSSNSALRRGRLGCRAGARSGYLVRGLILYQQGRVTHTPDTRLTATVQPPADALYQVEWAFDLILSDIDAICTCPDYGMGALCHHIWATILAADYFLSR
jgi:uncharacterized Zn finger protein